MGGFGLKWMFNKPVAFWGLEDHPSSFKRLTLGVNAGLQAS